MHKIVYRPKFCSLEPKIGQLEIIMKEKDSFGKIWLYFKHAKTVKDMGVLLPRIFISCTPFPFVLQVIDIETTGLIEYVQCENQFKMPSLLHLKIFW